MSSLLLSLIVDRDNSNNGVVPNVYDTDYRDRKHSEIRKGTEVCITHGFRCASLNQIRSKEGGERRRARHLRLPPPDSSKALPCRSVLHNSGCRGGRAGVHLLARSQQQARVLTAREGCRRTPPPTLRVTVFKPHAVGILIRGTFREAAAASAAASNRQHHDPSSISVVVFGVYGCYSSYC